MVEPMVQGTQSFGKVRHARCAIPYVLCVVCIDLDDVVFRGNPCPPLYSLRGQGYMKILAVYYLWNPSQCLSSSFLLFD